MNARNKLNAACVQGAFVFAGIGGVPVDAVGLGVIVVVGPRGRVDVDREPAAGDRGNRLTGGLGDGKVNVACGH